MNTPPTFDGKTVLVVDDETELRALISGFLKRRKFTVFEADNGNAAFEVFNAQHLDLIISDMNMPLGNGMDLLKNLGKSDRPKPPVILISGQSDASDEEILQAGAARVLPKPFDLKALTETIASLFATI